MVDFFVYQGVDEFGRRLCTCSICGGIYPGWDTSSRVRNDCRRFACIQHVSSSDRVPAVKQRNKSSVEAVRMHGITYAVGISISIAVMLHVIGKAVMLRWK